MTGQADADTVAKVLDAFNRRDVEAILEHFADDVEFRAPAGPDPQGRRMLGKAAVRDAFAARFAAVPDISWTDDETWICDRGIASRWRVAGTAVDGQRLDICGCDFWKLRDGKIVLKDTYYKSRT
ncbi:MAG: nuclear transport factor 2 family protein [Pseudomonadota bacterium]|jgi:ketosteroid isomerase-like protein